MTSIENRATTLSATIRNAEPTDSDFLAWAMLTAARSHLQRGVWDHLLARDEPDTLRWLSALARREPDHLFHWSTFLVAEVDGQPAAALSGYDPATQGLDVYLPIAVALYLETGATEHDLEPLIARGNDLRSAMAPPREGAWVVENVATAPAFRRRGLIDELLPAILDRGRERGHVTAQLSVFIGNAPARRAYLKHGFQPDGETRAREWEAAIGCPGIERLVRPL